MKKHSNRPFPACTELAQRVSVLEREREWRGVGGRVPCSDYSERKVSYEWTEGNPWEKSHKEVGKVNGEWILFGRRGLYIGAGWRGWGGGG